MPAKSTTSPTARTLAALRKDGWLVAVVEKWNAHVGVRQDLWGFADLLAVDPVAGRFMLVQATTLGNLSSRLKKSKAKAELAAWLRAGGCFEVHGWFLAKETGRWKVKRVEVRLGETDVILTPGRERKRGKLRQGVLFGR